MTTTPETRVTMRLASMEDVELLTDLGRTTFFDTFAAQNTEADMVAYLETTFTRAKVAAEIADPRARFLIAEIGGEAVGYAKLLIGSTENAIIGSYPVELVRLYATRTYIGQGIGAALMRACLAAAVEQSGQSLWLGVWEHNERAQAFYRKWGFKPVGSHTFQLGSDPQTDILMQRDLP